MSKIEYRVRPVTRYIVTRYVHSEIDPDNARFLAKAGSSTHGEYDNADTAYEVGYALAKAEADRLNYPPGDLRMVFPRHPDEETSANIPFAPKRPMLGGVSAEITD